VSGRSPSRPEEVEGVSQTASPSTGQRHGLARVCRLADLFRSTVYFRRHHATIPVEERREPKWYGPRGGYSVVAQSPLLCNGFQLRITGVAVTNGTKPFDLDHDLATCLE
jgi:hypothetical protein